MAVFAAWSPTAYTLIPAVAAVLVFGLAGVVVRWYGETPEAVPLAALLAAIGGWALLSAVQLGFTTPGAQFFWSRAATGVSAWVPVTWFVFTVTYAGYDRWLSQRVVGLLALEPLVFDVLLWARPHLFWRDPALVRTVTPPNLTVTYAPAFYGHLLYGYLLILVGLAALLSVGWRASAVYRWQTGLLVVGAFVPLVANVAFTLGPTGPAAVDLTPFTFVLTGVVFAVALFEFDLLDLTPVAQRRLIETLGNGLLVVDTDGRVTHANDVARTVFPDAAVGLTAAEVLDVDDVTELDGATRSVEREGREAAFDVYVSPLTDFRDRTIGHVVALQDVSDRHRYEQRLEVTNRLLRHNLRNEMTKVLGWADLVATETDDGHVETVARDIEAVAADLVDFGQTARHIETTVDHGGERVDVVDVLADVVAMARREWPHAEVSLDAPETAGVGVIGRSAIETAFRSLVENAVEHNDAPTPHVWVTVERRGDAVTVEVVDDGPGIPDIELESLRAGETSLRHGAGLGLWVVRWVVESSDGEISFADRDPEGTRVVVELPAARAAASAESVPGATPSRDT